MAALTRPSVLVADPANFLKANGAAYIRVGSIVMAAYEYAYFAPGHPMYPLIDHHPSYVLTLPAEWRFYSGRQGGRRWGCLLFILIRYGWKISFHDVRLMI